jgi:hypothetical protein
VPIRASDIVSPYARIPNGSDSFLSSGGTGGKVPDAAKVTNDCARDAGLDALPNDLTRLLYLASLRDCNSGRYLHPWLSPRMGTEMADQALRDCHVKAFRCLLTTSASGYVQQLEEYIRYSRTEKNALLDTWETLQAYRATVPLSALPLYWELFCLNIEVALMILRATGSGSQEAASCCA